MVRIENIQSKLTQLVKYLELVERYQAQTFSELLIDPDRLGACERYLFLACQCAIDLAEMTCKIKKLPQPESMAEAFQNMRQAGLIDDILCTQMIQMVGFRNALSHGYEKFNYSVLEEVLKNKIQELWRFKDCFESF